MSVISLFSVIVLLKSIFIWIYLSIYFFIYLSQASSRRIALFMLNFEMLNYEMLELRELA